MTIRGLSKYLKDKGIPKMGRSHDNDPDPVYTLNQLKGRRIAIEVAGMIYRQNYAAVKYVVDRHSFILTDDGWSRPAEHEILQMFKVYFRSLIKRICGTGIYPLFVMEGKSPEMKGCTIQRRINTKNDIIDKVNSIKDCPDLREYKQKLIYAYTPNTSHMEIVKEVLKEQSVKVVHAKHEGEGVCACLVNLPDTHPLRCDVALTDDYDIFMYGCRAVIRNLRSISGGSFEIEAYAFVDILTTLGFLDSTHTDIDLASERFKLFCILCGSDYSENIRGLGPAKVCNLILKHDIMSYEEICEIEPRFRMIPYQDIIHVLESNKEYMVDE